MQKGVVVLVLLLASLSASAIYTGYVNPYAAQQRGYGAIEGPFKPSVEYPGVIQSYRGCSRTSCVEGSTKPYLSCCGGSVCRASKCIPTAQPVYPMKEYPAYNLRVGCKQEYDFCASSRQCCVGMRCSSGQCRPVAALMSGEAKYYNKPPSTPTIEQPTLPTRYRPYPTTYSVPG